MQDFFRLVNNYTIPRWHLGTYLLLALYVAWATDQGVSSAACLLLCFRGHRC